MYKTQDYEQIINNSIITSYFRMDYYNRRKLFSWVFQFNVPHEYKESSRQTSGFR